MLKKNLEKTQSDMNNKGLIDKIEKIRRKVKELQDEFISIQPKDCSLELIKSYAGYAYLDKVLSFLDTLSVEAPEGLDEAAKEYEWSNVDTNQLNPPTLDMIVQVGDLRDAFKAGAEWRDAQLPKLPDNLEEAAEISFDEANALTEDYMDFLAEGLTENKPRPIGPHWFSEYAKKRFIAGAEWAFGQFEMLEMNGRKCGLLGNSLYMDISDSERRVFDIYIRKK